MRTYTWPWLVLTLCLTATAAQAQAQAQIAPTPDVYSADRVAPATQAVIDAQLAKAANPAAPSYVVDRARGLVRLLNPSHPGLNNRYGPTAPLEPYDPAMLTRGEAIDLEKPVPYAANLLEAGYLANRVVMQEPGNARARVLRAQAITYLDEPALGPVAWDDATRALSDASAAPQTVASAHHVRGLWLKAIKDTAGVVREYDAAIAADPARTAFYGERGLALAELGRDESAVADLSRYIAARPDGFAHALTRGRIYHSQKKYDLALADFDRLERSFGYLPEVRVARIRLLDDMGRKADADQAHLQFLKDKPDEAKANAYLAARATPSMEADAKAQLRDRGLDMMAAIMVRHNEADIMFREIIALSETMSTQDDLDKLRAIAFDARKVYVELGYMAHELVVDSEAGKALTPDEYAIAVQLRDEFRRREEFLGKIVEPGKASNP